MLTRKQFPILEYDDNPHAKIEPFEHLQRQDVPPHCVITFFSEVIGELLKQGKLTQIGHFDSEMIDIPIYETEYKNRRIAIVQGFVGSAGSATLLERLIAVGFNRFIACGGAGVLQKDIQVGHLIVPVVAIRDEGTSYHYLPPSREVACNPHAVEIIEKQLQLDKIPYIKSKTWTTDALFRETEDKINLRIEEGCVTVEMEAAALFAVAKFRNVILGQILYGGDDLSGDKWDSRLWDNQSDIRKNLVDLSLKICLQL